MSADQQVVQSLQHEEHAERRDERGIPKTVVTKPLVMPDGGGAAERDRERQPFVHVVADEQDGPDDRRKGEVLPDREVELAADHEHRHADGDDADGRRHRGDRRHRLRRPEVWRLQREEQHDAEQAQCGRQLAHLQQRLEERSR